MLSAHLQQIERVNPRVNAIVTLVPELAMKAARQADEVTMRGAAVGPLHGLPIAHKDLQLTKDMRTTFGSPIFKDFVPAQDSLVVERLRQAGAIALGKTNTPEFGAGSQTFNAVFGPTLNPYALTKTCGGSSGGAAVALACGMIPIADGSDMGGSLRNPAAFCNVVGLRPSPVHVWRRHGSELGFGAGIAQGYATLGQVGFSERSGYTAIGTVCNLAARLCAEAKDGQILVSSRIAEAVEAVATLEDLGNLELRGLRRPVAAFNVVQSTSAADARPNLTVVARGPGA